MVLSELIELLEDLKEEFGEDVDPEVRLAMQPAYPFEYTISSVVGVEFDGKNKEPIIYIAEQEQVAYLSDEVVEALGW